MLALEQRRTCRLSGEPLAGAPVLAEVSSCPLPGVYPPAADQSAPLRSALRVVQAAGSGFVQLAHRLDSAVYERYGFAADTSGSYRRHLAWFAGEVAAARPPDTPILEVGCGDGLLLELLEQRGMHDRFGIDPGRAAAGCGRADVVHGYFPEGLPAGIQARRFGVIILRHVLEHIETPRAFVAALAARLEPGGELWIEVPDLDSTIAAGLWTNFYQLHCNYFTDRTLDQVAAGAGLECAAGQVVDVFGGSLLRRYRAGVANQQPAAPGVSDLPRGGFAASAERLQALARRLPDGAAGYGAAERTAVALGMAPELEHRLDALYDGNTLLHDRYLAGTRLQILGSELLFDAPPPALVLFALSHREEILAQWRERLPGDTLVGLAGGDCELRRLDETSRGLTMIGAGGSRSG